MEIKNKFQKILLGLSGLFLMAIVILGIKIRDDNKKMAQFLKALNSGKEGYDPQEAISQRRDAILRKVANSSAPDIAQKITTETVVPGKTIKETVPVTDSGNKTPSKSSTSKKTKTS